MNRFREKMLGGKEVRGPLLRTKEIKAYPSRAAEEESFSDLTIPRETGRLTNHRDADRHRLADEEATLILDGAETRVTLINLSGGGAMIEGASELKLWDRIELRLGGCGALEAVVRWVRGARIGLEFAHETRIEATSDEVAATLREVIRRSFPDIALEEAAAARQVLNVPEDKAAPSTVQDSAEDFADRDVRHPLIWSGLVHFNHDSTPVRLRNISKGGALIEASVVLPVGSELLLDLGDAGAIFATVHWARGDQAGLKFHAPYDVSALARARPEVAGPRWIAPDYLRDDRTSSSPWASQWGRADLGRLHRALELKTPHLRRD